MQIDIDNVTFLRKQYLFKPVVFVMICPGNTFVETQQYLEPEQYKKQYEYGYENV